MRKLSDYQKRAWMQKISKLPHKWPDRRGEKNPMVRLSDQQVFFIRKMSGTKASYLANLCGISERYVYQLWAGERRK